MPSTPARTQVPNGPLSDMRWLAGSWTGTSDSDGVVREVWTAPAHDRMVGAFTWTRPGRAIVHELLLVAVEEGRPVLLLRHFDDQLEPWEDAALRYALVESGPRHVVFERREGEERTRIRYDARGANGLDFTLESWTAGVPAEPLELSFDRSDP